ARAATISTWVASCSGVGVGVSRLTETCRAAPAVSFGSDCRFIIQWCAYLTWSDNSDGTGGRTHGRSHPFRRAGHRVDHLPAQVGMLGGGGSSRMLESDCAREAQTGSGADSRRYDSELRPPYHDRDYPGRHPPGAAIYGG